MQCNYWHVYSIFNTYFKTTFQKCCFINKVANYFTVHTISDLMFGHLSTTILRQQNERARPAIKGCLMTMQLTTIHHFTIENNNNIINIITFWLWLVTKLITNFVTRHNRKNLTCAHFQKKILCEKCKKN